MREIKFRGKTPDGRWVYGDLETRRLDGRCFIHTYTEDRIYYTQFEILPDTIGQYTGLKDANGKEIYEGDVIESPNPTCSHHIGYSEAEGGFIAFLCKTGYYYCSLRPGWINEFHKRVVGNIHDNPELM